MDFLDPKKMRRQAILLYTGYVFIGIAVLISTIVLVYQANGFGVNSKGQVVQNGLVFVSSNPNPAKIYLNTKLNTTQTNARLNLPTGRYNLKLTRTGYRDWQRTINVQGGDVQNYDYPFLFPIKLDTTSQAPYATAPGVAGQSRDRRWLAVQQGSTTTFDIYDLKANQLAPTQITLPASVVSSAPGAQSWEILQWANDAQHFLLRHANGASNEFIIVDRQDATNAINLNKALGTNPVSLTLVDNKYDQYYFQDGSATLFRASKDSPTPVEVLKNVLSYKSYGTKRLLYATAQGAPAGKVNIMILDDQNSYTLREVSAGTTYLLDLADYAGSQYVIVSASSENIAYIYRNPLTQLTNASNSPATAMRALRVSNSSYVSFSPSTRYIMDQSGSQFGIYDIFLNRTYNYNLPDPLDSPQPHATWMDGDHLTYTTSGKQLVVDVDGHNPQTLMPVNVAQGAFFSQDYRYVFEFAPNVTGVSQLYRTALRVAADL